MNKISVTSRIILAVASLSLIATYFLPVWRIDLYAPQYPEGLVMKIWLTTLKGDIDIINGLNHYIGMHHISVEMFPEFEYLVYVVGFYILLGLAVAVIGNRKILFWYLVFTLFGAVFAAYDYYRWGYEYGHNLDPAAPIKVPGLAYQPPLIGHKRLLNFDAYSFPDFGGWIVIGAATTFFLVWFFEQYKIRKKRRIIAAATVISVFSLLFSSCSVKPEPIKYGTDSCANCKMGISDLKFGSEIVTKKGKVYKFDDVGCMVQFLKKGTIAQNDIAYSLVINYEKQHDLLDVNKASFVVSEEIRSPMNFNTAAFDGGEAANRYISEKKGKLSGWNEIYSTIE